MRKTIIKDGTTKKIDLIIEEGIYWLELYEKGKLLYMIGGEIMDKIIEAIKKERRN